VKTQTGHSLLIADLQEGYRSGRVTPRDVIEAVLQSIDAAPQRNVWITRLSREQVMSYVAALERRPREQLPLFGVPFAIKDNIDLAGVKTTAACPEFAYVPERSATVVQKLIDAGAIPIGKTNLDQFATGLVGVRSPYGACQNSFDPKYISGGSSSGSAVAVASGLVSFSLGTDTAGSGRVPAAFNNIVGLKATCGLLSTQGVVPACRSLDAVSIFALTATDASAVLQVAQGFDAADSYSKQLALKPSLATALRIGIPRADQLEFFGDEQYRDLFIAACDRLVSLGATPVVIDVAPFLETARLLYEGPWVAERYAAISSFIEQHSNAIHPVTKQITVGGAKPTAIDAFRAQYRLKELQRTTSTAWRDVDLFMLPTAATIYTIDDVVANPIRLNSNLGIYTNFVNLLDLTAFAVPAGFRSDGLPFGVTLIAQATHDRTLLDFGARLHHASVATLGALNRPVPEPISQPPISTDIHVVVCGAHMAGLPLNHQLLDRGARLVRATQTAPHYRFYALPGGPPKRPGLVRVAAEGAAIAVEVWSVPQEHFGSFVAGIPAPLGIGKVEFADGSVASGFICEAYAVEGAQEITQLGSWRKYLRQGDQ
jgi:allophanate hydrolase